MRGILPVLAVVVLVATACGEKERRAEVSILPAEEAETSEPQPAGRLSVSPDGRAVLLGSDTLFTAGRLPGKGPDETLPGPVRFQRVAFSPDSSRVAFTTSGPDPAVGIWSRTAQIGRFLDVFQGGSADTLAWGPDGRQLAWAGRTSEGVSRVAISDPGGRRLPHPLVEWLLRQGRSTRLEGWIDPGRLRVRVADASGARPARAYVWDTRRSHFTFEEHLAPLIEQAPGAPPVPGGVFSLDLDGDGRVETIALFRSGGDGAPAAVVLHGPEHRARVTDPLIEPAILGLESWEKGSGRIGLYAPVRFASGTAVLLALPSGRPGLTAVGVFEIGAGGTLEPFPVATAQGDRPAIFFDGRAGEESWQLGLLDLDGDAIPEVVSAVGRRGGNEGERAVHWRAAVFRGRAGRLVPAPELAGAALERIAEATTR